MKTFGDRAFRNRHCGTTPSADARITLLGHDLRAAVSDIIGGLRLIDHAALDDGTRLQLERIRASGEMLARLLEEGLSLMLGEDDIGAHHPANIQMARFLYDLDMRWSGRAREKGLILRLDVAARPPAGVATDRVALERVLANILSNAIKYTDQGDVSLDVTLCGGATCGSRFHDTGPGVLRCCAGTLVPIYGRPDDTAKPGQGLGMHISKVMTARLGGTIAVENRPAKAARP